MSRKHAFTSSFLPSLLALLAGSGCDPALGDDGAEMTATDTAGPDGADDDAADDDAGDDDGGLDETGGADDGAPDPGPEPGGDPGFDNDPGQAFGALDGMVFTCSEGVEDAYYNVVFEAGVITVIDPEGATVGQGTYTVDDAGITLSVPDLGFQETSVAHEIELDVVATFKTPSFFCHAVALDADPAAMTTILKCPDIRYIPSVSFEHHEFHFATDGSVRRRKWVELLGANDTLYSQSWGIYVELGDRVFMFFGGSKEVRFQVGTKGQGGLYIDDLEPEAGPCTDNF